MQIDRIRRRVDQIQERALTQDHLDIIRLLETIKERDERIRKLLRYGLDDGL